MKKQFILAFVLIAVTTSFFAQANRKFIDTGSVNNQFDYLINKSYKYKNYKNVDINWLYNLKSNVTDSLSASKKLISNNYHIINTQKNTIDSLNTSLSLSKKSITNLTNEKQSISFFGIQFSKAFFKSLLFSIIGILIILLVYFIARFKQSNTITIQTKDSLKELEDEFDVHRKTALEREQKVMRKLQDELNKQKKE